MREENEHTEESRAVSTLLNAERRASIDHRAVDSSMRRSESPGHRIEGRM